MFRSNVASPKTPNAIGQEVLNRCLNSFCQFTDAFLGFDRGKDPLCAAKRMVSLARLRRCVLLCLQIILFKRRFSTGLVNACLSSNSRKT